MFSFRAHFFDRELEMGQMLTYVLLILFVSLIVQTVLYAKTYKKK